MKTFIACLFAIGIAFVINFEAAGQTVTTNASTNTVWGDIKQLLTDEGSFFGTNTDLTIDAGALYSQKQWGALLDVHTPLPIGTNAQVSAGITGLYIGGQFYEASLSIKGGTTLFPNKWYSVFTWAETGPGMNLHSHSVISETFAGATKGWDVYKGFYLYVSGLTGNISDRSGVAYGGTLSFTAKF